ncbi:hypothetical protein [Spongiactinospora sp. 9N601]|uniref:hypothetical protein n=1 Tax=Spongiactinospora sp. 9N601 TaxID=3375149 RepID=UPI0037908D92
MTTSSLTCGPLSLQQEAAQRNWHGKDIISKSFDLPASISEEELHRRVRRMIERERGLRTVAYDREGVTYADRLAAPIYYVTCATPSQMDEASRAARRVEWAPNGPIWRLVVFRRTGAAPSAPRRALLVIDHMICDNVTVGLMVREILTGREPDAVRGGGRHDEWSRQQRLHFDPGDPEVRRRAREFWTAALGGTSPRRATPLPGVRDASPGVSRGAVALSVHVPVDAESAAAAAREAGATPFTLALASFAATLANGAGLDDLSFAITTPGRPPDFAAAYGWMATQVPLRVAGEGLREFGTALDAVRGAWSRILGRLHNPWEFVVAACADSGELDWDPCGRRQLVINYFAEPVAGITGEHYRDKHPEYLRGMRWIELQVVPLVSGGYLFRFLCDSDDVDRESVRDLLRRLADGYTDHVNTILGAIR